MMVKVNLNTLLTQYAADQGVVEVEGSTVGQCLEQLVERFPGIKKALFNDDGSLLNIIEVFINEESTYPDELAHPVKPGDELYILFAIDGG